MFAWGIPKQRFVCVYRPPSDTVVNARLIKRCLDSLCSVSYAVCVTGDFNLPGIDWDTFECPKYGVHDLLLDCFVTNCLFQCVREPTRENNILDLVLCADESSVLDVCVRETFTEACDHKMVEFVIRGANPKISSQKQFRDFKKADYNGISEFLSTVNWDALFEDCVTANEYYEVFQVVVNTAIEKYVPVRTFKGAVRIRG